MRQRGGVRPSEGILSGLGEAIAQCTDALKLRCPGMPVCVVGGGDVFVCQQIQHVASMLALHAKPASASLRFVCVWGGGGHGALIDFVRHIWTCIWLQASNAGCSVPLVAHEL